ncbi:putative GTPase activating protein for Arf-domain-containing protein [Cryomyces antarcticus]
MSRRPNPGADRAAQNQQTLKSLVKVEGNKSCADCKKNKHPRWASWNLGIFICIRCSGIHRGMGTHISRVKSVDLDSWTDEQLQSMLRWGNSRANKYWEAKLAPGHVPSESKIENFIRTKYDSKRWVMDGGIPDPATLDVDGDDDVPLNVVQEKAKLERSASQRASSASSQPSQQLNRRNQNADLFGDDPPSRFIRPNTTEPIQSRAPPPPPKGDVAPPKQTKPADSLLGLDFFGGPAAAPPARPSSATSSAVGSGTPSRPDLKQSILSLYASKPPPPPQHQRTSSNSFGGLPSPSQQQAQQSSFSGLSDAFGGLGLSSPSAQQQAPKASPFAGLDAPSPRKQSTSSAFGTGGGFFNSNPKPTSTTSAQAPNPQASSTQGVSSGFGDFGDFSAGPSSTMGASMKPVPAATSSMGDLFDFASQASPPAPQPAKATAPSYTNNSAFNLSAPAPQAQPKPPPTQSSTFSNMDPWASNDAWSTPDPGPAPAPQMSTSSVRPPPAQTVTAGDFGGWGSMAPAKPAEPKITQDDDFGGWSSAAPVSPRAGSKPPGFGGSEDLFSNVWE